MAMKFDLFEKKLKILLRMVGGCVITRSTQRISVL
jgi:hypothetical protein